MPTWFSSLLSLACEQPSRQHKLNVMIVHAPSNNGKYAKPCPINNLLENKNKLVLQRPSIDLSISTVLKILWPGGVECWPWYDASFDLNLACLFVDAKDDVIQ